MKKLLLLLMILPMIGFGQIKMDCTDNIIGDNWEEGTHPESLLYLLSCAAQNKDAFGLSFIYEHQYIKESGYFECNHLGEFIELLYLSEGDNLTNKEIKRLNNYVSGYSIYVENYEFSDRIWFGGKEYVRAEGYDFYDGYDQYNYFLFVHNDGDWQIIFHPEKQKKSIRKYFKQYGKWEQYEGN